MAQFRLLIVFCCILLAKAINDTHNVIHPNWTEYDFPDVSIHPVKCPIERETIIEPDKDLFFAILFYDDPYDELRHRVTINAAIDVAIQRVQAPGGLLEGFRISTEYRDSQSSSLQGALAAWDFHYIHQPGSSKGEC